MTEISECIQQCKYQHKEAPLLVEDVHQALHLRNVEVPATGAFVSASGWMYFTVLTRPARSIVNRHIHHVFLHLWQG